MWGSWKQCGRKSSYECYGFHNMVGTGHLSGGREVKNKKSLRMIKMKISADGNWQEMDCIGAVSCTYMELNLHVQTSTPPTSTPPLMVSPHTTTATATPAFLSPILSLPQTQTISQMKQYLMNFNQCCVPPSLFIVGENKCKPLCKNFH